MCTMVSVLTTAYDVVVVFGIWLPVSERKTPETSPITSAMIIVKTAIEVVMADFFNFYHSRNRSSIPTALYTFSH